MIKIPHRDPDRPAVYASTTAETMREVVVEAVVEGAVLRGAVLRGAYLRGAYLRGADLRDADLTGANLRGTVLHGVDLRGVDLRGADFGVNLDALRVPDLDAQILAELDAGGELVMTTWHSPTCGTTHCRAGWAITLAGSAARSLEDTHGPAYAGALVYYASTGAVPDFYANNEDALADMRRAAGVSP